MVVQEHTSLVVVANAVSRFDGSAANLEVGVLGQVQTIGKGCSQKTFAAGREESATDREACHLLTECLGLLGGGPSSRITQLAKIKQSDNPIIAAGGQSVSIRVEAVKCIEWKAR